MLSYLFLKVLLDMVDGVVQWLNHHAVIILCI